MEVFVSPYHLTTREPPAVASLLLADRVVTLMPAPFDAGGGQGPARESLERAVERSPRYLKFMQSWQWTMPLWDAGVVVSGMQGQEVAQDAAAVCRRVEHDQRYRPLLALMRPELFENEERYLDAVAADLLKGGPDPGISVPLAAGIDRFAVRHGLMVARSEPSSVAQRAEARLGRRLFGVAVPVLLQSGGARLLEARQLLADELEDLRDRMAAGAEAATMDGCEDEGFGGARESVAEAARAYAAAFEDRREQIAAVEEDEDEPRVVEGVVGVTAVLLPADAVLRSSVAAMGALWPGAARAVGAVEATNLPVLHDPAERGQFVSLVVKVIGRGSLGRASFPPR